MSIKLLWLTWDRDHGLITLQWTNFEEKKVSWTFIYIDLNYFSPRGFNTHTHAHTKSENRRVFLALPPSSSWDFGVSVWRCLKKKREGKIARGTWQRIWPVPLQLEAEKREPSFSHTSHIQAQRWKEESGAPVGESLHLPLSAERCVQSGTIRTLCQPTPSALGLHTQNKINNNKGFHVYQGSRGLQLHINLLSVLWHHS